MEQGTEIRTETGLATTRGKLGFRLTAREFDLLEFVLEQKFASLDALYPRFYQRGESRSERYAAERVQLLRRHGFLRAERAYTRPELFYVVTPLGRDVLQGQRPARRVLEVAGGIDHRTFEHDWRVTLCRAYRERAGQAREWVSERRLKAEWATNTGRLAREYCPDAVYTNRLGERVAFELELAPKVRERHLRKISRFLDVMQGGAGPFSRTLFVACDSAVKQTLESMTRPYPDHFRVMGYDAALRSGQDGPAAASSGEALERSGDVLARGAQGEGAVDVGH